MAHPGDIELLLESAFSETELAFLNQQPQFRTAVASAKTLDDFDTLCDLAKEIFDQHRDWRIN